MGLHGCLIYNENIKCIGYHEDVHLISYNALARPKETFIREGLAMFFDKVWWGLPNQAWVQELIECNRYLSICDLMDNDEFYKYNDFITYPIAGAFTEYLFSFYGIEKHKKFYLNTTDDVQQNFLKSFNISLKMLKMNL